MDNPTDDLCALCFPTLDGRFDDFAVRFRSNGTGASGTSCAGSTADAVEVDFVGLGRFVVDDCFDAFDVKAAGGNVRGEEVGSCG